MLGVGGGELLALLVIGLLVLGPERLPRYAAEAGRFLHMVRTMARQAREDVRSSLEPELRDLGLDQKDVAAWFGDSGDGPEEPWLAKPVATSLAKPAVPPSYPDAT